MKKNHWTLLKPLQGVPKWQNTLSYTPVAGRRTPHSTIVKNEKDQRKERATEGKAAKRGGNRGTTNKHLNTTTVAVAEEERAGGRGGAGGIRSCSERYRHIR